MPEPDPPRINSKSRNVFPNIVKSYSIGVQYSISDIPQNDSIKVYVKDTFKLIVDE
jgi:hypothetical protein